jgi:hypothetical protein
MSNIGKASRRIASVTVEYTVRGGRVTKTFENVFKARAFYKVKYKAGADPKVIGGSRV